MILKIIIYKDKINTLSFLSTNNINFVLNIVLNICIIII